MNTKKTLAEILIVIIAAAITSSSCSKEEWPTPSEQVITYTLKCDDCLIYLEDDKWNAGNELQRSKNQHFNVKGSFWYQFTNTTGLNSVTGKIWVSALTQGPQVVYLSIRYNQGRSVEVRDTLGYSPDWTKIYDYELSAKLDLR